MPGTAVFLTSDPKSAPTALMHSLKHYKVLHEKNIIVSVEITHTPRAAHDKRVRIEPVGATFQRVALRFGYMETPNIPKALGLARKLGLQFDIMSTSFFLSRRTLRRAPHSECRAGKISCLSRLPARLTTRRTISKFRPIGWSR